MTPTTPLPMNYASAARAAWTAWRADLDRQRASAGRVRALCESEPNTDDWLRRVSVDRLRRLAENGHRWAMAELQRRGREVA